MVNNQRIGFSDKKFILLGFFISPFFTLLFNLKNRNTETIANLLWAFCIFVGMTFAIGIESENADINRYTEQLEFFRESKLGSISQVFQLTIEGGDYDFYSPLIIFFTSLITSNYLLLTTLFAFVFGYFLSRNILILLNWGKSNGAWIAAIFTIFFFFLNPIWNINGVRYYTALQIFIYGFLRFEFLNDKKSIFLCLITPFFHFSFFIVYIFLPIILVAKKFPHILFGIFILSVISAEFLTNEMISNAFASLNLGELGKGRDGYLDLDLREQYLDELGEVNINWYIKYLGKILNYSINFTVIYTYYISRNYLNGKSIFSKLFSASLVLLIIGNFLSQHAVIGRFYSVGAMAWIAFMVYSFQYYDVLKSWNKLYLTKNILVLSILFYCFIEFRTSLYCFSLSTFFSNPIVSIFTDEFVSVNDFIKFGK
jgi:hypothetical protein